MARRKKAKVSKKGDRTTSPSPEHVWHKAFSYKGKDGRKVSIRGHWERLPVPKSKAKREGPDRELRERNAKGAAQDA